MLVEKHMHMVIDKRHNEIAIARRAGLIAAKFAGPKV